MPAAAAPSRSFSEFPTWVDSGSAMRCSRKVYSTVIIP
jgi:hypothetical protein